MQSKAKTVTEYLKELPKDRRVAMQTVRKVLKAHMPKGYQETMGYGMMGYAVPLKRYPEGYLGNPKIPLAYVGLASQKNYMSLYLTCIYSDPKEMKWFKDAYKKSGKKLNMGKSCIRFKKVEELDLPTIGKMVERISVEDLINLYESNGRSYKSKRA